MQALTFVENVSSVIRGGKYFAIVIATATAYSGGPFDTSAISKPGWYFSRSFTSSFAKISAFATMRAFRNCSIAFCRVVSGGMGCVMKAISQAAGAGPDRAVEHRLGLLHALQRVAKLLCDFRQHFGTVLPCGGLIGRRAILCHEPTAVEAIDPNHPDTHAQGVESLASNAVSDFFALGIDTQDAPAETPDFKPFYAMDVRDCGFGGLIGRHVHSFAVWAGDQFIAAAPTRPSL
jgi:hypothetical protein